MTKRVFSLLLACAVLASFSACAKSEQIKTDASGQPPVPEALPISETGTVPLSGRYEAVYTTKQGVKISFDAEIHAPASTGAVLKTELTGLPEETVRRMLACFAGDAGLYTIAADGQREPFPTENALPESFEVCFDDGNAAPAKFGVQSQQNNGGRYSVSYSNYSFNGCYSNHVPYSTSSAADSAPARENAVDEAERFLADIGLTEFHYAYAQYGYAYSYDSNTASADPGSIKLYFTRSYEGLDTPYVEMNSWANNHAGSSGNSVMRTAEYIAVELDGTGIVHFVYMNPVAISGKTGENVALIKADEAVSLFLGAMETYPASEGDIMVSEITLGYQFCPDAEDRANYDLVPCWIFIGTDSVWSAGFGTRTAQLIISAVDGSIVG